MGSSTPAARIPSGFPKYRNNMVIGFATLTVTYLCVIAAFDSIQAVLNLPPAAREFCPLEYPCWRPDLLAFEVTSGLALAWCGWIGFYSWHIKRIQQSVPKTPEGRLFGYLEEGNLLTAVSTTFQLFDLMISLLIPEQRQFLFLCHHVMAATVSWYGLNNQVCWGLQCHNNPKKDLQTGGSVDFLTHLFSLSETLQYFHYYGRECGARKISFVLMDSCLCPFTSSDANPHMPHCSFYSVLSRLFRDFDHPIDRRRSCKILSSPPRNKL